MAENPSFAKQYLTYVGKTVGIYYLERLLENVETGPIFLARSTNTQTKRSYRLRVLALPGGLTPEERLLYLGHFQHEATQVVELQHRALLPLYDFGIFEGTPYLVLPDQPGISFQSMVANSGPVDTRQAGRYLDGIATVLEYIHQQGILHLNMNARNIFINQDGRPRVAETGLVRMFAPQLRPKSIPTTNQPRELENGSPLLRDQQGKPLYGLNLASAPAPELLLGQPPDASTDVYALGALFYYLLTGHRAMRGRTLADIADQHLNAAVPSLTLWRQGLSEDLDRLLSSAMAKHRTARLRHPGALANAYTEITMSGESGRRVFAAPALSEPFNAPVTPKHAMLPMLPGATPWLSRRRAITLLATGGGVVIAGIAAWTLGHTGSSNPTAPIVSSTSVPSTQSAAGSSSTSGHSGTVLAKVGDVPVNRAKTFPIAHSDNPGVLIHLPNSQFVAFNSTCTHAGCAVAYNQQNHLLECPCHGASFDPARNAAVVNGPASSPLAVIAITVNKDGTVTTNG